MDRMCNIINFSSPFLNLNVLDHKNFHTQLVKIKMDWKNSYQFMFSNHSQRLLYLIKMLDDEITSATNQIIK